MKICKDGRISGQNNKEAGNHLGILSGRRKSVYIKKGRARGNKNPMFGRDLSGSKNPNWKGGVTTVYMKIRHQIDSRLWREAIFARDNWTCQECGKRGGRLNAHHIKSFKQYPELRFAIDNGETLCYNCHKKINNFTGEVRI